MAAELPVVTIVLFIASGTLVFVLLFLFAKRQIMRFALKSARKPHITIGSDAPKEMRDEIQRRLGLVQNVRYEPTLLTEQVHHRALTETNHYFHRMKALDAFTNAVECLRSQDKTISLRSTKQTIQLYLFSLCPSTPGTAQAHVIHQFCCTYNHARHSPSKTEYLSFVLSQDFIIEMLNHHGLFADTEFINYMELLDKVIRMIKSDQARRSANLDPPVETEVRIRKGRGDTETAETVPHVSTSTRRKAPLLASRSAARPEQLEQISLVDKSSGYSSTDHSSSGRGSAERLISPHLSVMQRDEAV